MERHHPPDRQLPTGSSKDLDTTKAEFKAAWEVLKASTPPSLLAATYKAMILSGDKHVTEVSCRLSGLTIRRA